MKRRTVLPIKWGLFFSLFLSVWGIGVGVLYAVDYVGSEVCATCHMDKYNDWKVSGHPYMLSKAADARKRPIPLPKGYTWNDISYVIGGLYKKSRYIDNQGYIITAAKDGSALKTQYNIETGTWSFYHQGEKTPYQCGPCHMTNYSQEGHQDGLEGMIGTWTFPGIHCEECHGPGRDHAKNGDSTKIKIDKASVACGKCHIRGEAEKVPASGGFIQHHEQYPELIAGSHKVLNCVTCHDPHKKYRFSIKVACSSCHASQAASYKGTAMEQVGVSCIDCHMPRVTKSAVARGESEGDIRTHLFKINTDADANMFYTEEKEGIKSTYANGFTTLDFACLNCHKNKDMEWATAQAKGMHKKVNINYRK